MEPKETLDENDLQEEGSLIYKNKDAELPLNEEREAEIKKTAETIDLLMGRSIDALLAEIPEDDKSNQI